MRYKIFWLTSFIAGCILSIKVNVYLGSFVTGVCGFNYSILLGEE